MPLNIPAQTSYLTVPEVVERLGIGVSRVHRLLEDHHLAATRIDGVRSIPADFVLEDQPLPGLRGTMLVLLDAGFTNDEAIAWLLSHNAELGDTPVAQLRAGHKSSVRRATQGLAF